MVGQNIGKYRVLDRIGRGGMGTVYRAVDETLHRDVAIKVLNAELSDPEIARRFRAEAITVARLSHPGIATIYELFQHDGQWLMVMEFVRGETLERLVERSGPMPPTRTAELCMQALAALAHAHSMGVVHRDLKPANIMATEAGAIKIMDFGIARVAGTEHLTNAGFMMGTPAYMAPEQVLGHEIDARADLYAIGVVFYRLVAGKLPFKGETPFAMAQSQVNDPPAPIGTLRADLPPWVELLLDRALAKAPADRFQSAIEFHEALARCLDGLPMPAPYSSSAPTEMLRTPSRTSRTGALDRFGTGTAPVVDRAFDVTPPSQPLTRPAPELEPTVLAPTPVANRVIVTAAASTVMTPSREVQARPVSATAAEPERTPDPAPVAQVQQENVSPQPVADTAAPPKRPVAVIAAAIVVLLLGGGTVAWFLTRPTPPQTPDSGLASTVAAPATSAPELPAGETPPSAPLATAAPAPVPPPPIVTGDAATADTPKPSGRVGRSTGASASNTPVLAPEAPITFDDVKLIMVTERNKTNDQDVTLRFSDGQLAVLAKKTGTTLGALPYTNTVRATYLKARDPKWDPSVFGPPPNLDVGGVLRTSKHWLVVQGLGAYLILRLEDSNWRRVLDTVKTRTGVEISLPASADKP